jgi:hypothetical protein
MYSDICEFITDVVKKSTALGLAKYPKKKGTPAKEVSTLSKKALKAKEAIEEGDFDGYEDSVAKLISVILEEKIVLGHSCDDDFDGGKVITVPRFSLLVCIHGADDDYGDDIEKGETILKSSHIVMDAGDVCKSNPSNLLQKFNQYYYISADGTSNYVIEDIYENEFRFATEEEIEKFVKKLPKASLKFWLGELVSLFDVVLKQTDK